MPVCAPQTTRCSAVNRPERDSRRSLSPSLQSPNPCCCRHATASDGVKAAHDAAFRTLNEAYQQLMDGGWGGVGGWVGGGGGAPKARPPACCAACSRLLASLPSALIRNSRRRFTRPLLLTHAPPSLPWPFLPAQRHATGSVRVRQRPSAAAYGRAGYTGAAAGQRAGGGYSGAYNPFDSYHGSGTGKPEFRTPCSVGTVQAPGVGPSPLLACLHCRRRWQVWSRSRLTPASVQRHTPCRRQLLGVEAVPATRRLG